MTILDDRNSFVRFNSASRILSLIQDFTAQVDLMKEIQQLKEQLLYDEDDNDQEVKKQKNGNCNAPVLYVYMGCGGI